MTTSNTNRSLKHAPDDEAYWLSIRSTMEPMYINTQLVNSRRGPAPLIVRLKIHSVLDTALSYEVEEHEPFRDMKESGSSIALRSLLAEYFGTTKEEVAFMRNTMEGIATVINGIDMKPGDEILATKFDYDFNLAMIRQRAAREGIVLKFVEIPFGVACTDVVVMRAFEKAIGPRTKLITFPHVVGRTGMVFPVKEICELARKRGIFTLVDGAHSAGHLDFRIDELGCCAFAACLHKWMYGPRGTGLLYVRKEKIGDVWPLFAPYSNLEKGDIEKFEEVGTVFKVMAAAVPECIEFNTEIGQAKKAARFRYTRDRWARRLRQHPRVRMLVDVDQAPGTGFGAFTIEGMDDHEFIRILLDEFNISVKVFEMEEDPSMAGITVCPGLANTIEEIDRFTDAALAILSRE